MGFMITFRKLVCRCVFGGLLYLGHDFTLEFGVDMMASLRLPNL